MDLCKLKNYVCTPPALSQFPSSTVSFSRPPGIVLISTSAKKLNSSAVEIFNYHKCFFPQKNFRWYILSVLSEHKYTNRHLGR